MRFKKIKFIRVNFCALLRRVACSKFTSFKKYSSVTVDRCFYYYFIVFYVSLL